MKYHCLQNIKLIQQYHYQKSGRPGKSSQPNRISYKIQASLVINQGVFEAEMRSAGRFILATNLVDDEELSAESAFREYKEQQVNERGFRFLKNPLFFTSSVFVKKAERVEAIAMVMAISLLVYTLAQRQLRKALEQSGETIKNQVGKLTNRPTMRWIFQCFQSVHLLSLDGHKQVTNLNRERQKILFHLGSFCSYYYSCT